MRVFRVTSEGRLCLNCRPHTEHDLIPVCPVHRTPLSGDGCPDGYGRCMNGNGHITHRQMGRDLVPVVDNVIEQRDWLYLHRDVLDTSRSGPVFLWDRPPFTDTTLYGPQPVWEEETWQS